MIFRVSDVRSFSTMATSGSKSLEGRPDVTFRVYQADNHLFFPGSGPSAPAEYEPAQHVDGEVVAGIAAWIKSAFPASG